MKRLAGLGLIPALACVPLQKSNLTVDGQFRSAQADAEHLEDGGWRIRLALPNPKGTLQWQVLPEDPAEVVLEPGPEMARATWRISRQRWLDSKPLRVQVRNQNGLDLPMKLGHPSFEKTLPDALLVALQILSPVNWH